MKKFTHSRLCHEKQVCLCVCVTWRLSVYVSTSVVKCDARCSFAPRKKSLLLSSSLSNGHQWDRQTRTNWQKRKDVIEI